MDEKNNVTKSHKVLLANRKNGAFSGVVDVLSFDVAEILLETELGMLLIKDRFPDLFRAEKCYKTDGISSWKAF